MEREGAQQRWHRLCFGVGGAPHWGFLQTVFKDLGCCSSSWASRIPAQHKPSSLPVLPCSVSKVSAWDWCQPEIYWHKWLFLQFCFFHLSLCYPQQFEYSDSSDNREGCLQSVLKGDWQKREAQLFHMRFFFFLVFLNCQVPFNPNPASHSFDMTTKINNFIWSLNNFIFILVTLCPKAAGVVSSLILVPLSPKLLFPEMWSCWFNFLQTFPAVGLLYNGHAWAGSSIPGASPCAIQPKWACRALTNFHREKHRATDHSKMNLSCPLLRLTSLGYCLGISPRQHSSWTTAWNYSPEAPVSGAWQIFKAWGLPSKAQLQEREGGNVGVT